MAVSSIAPSIAAALIEKRLRDGYKIVIPSLGITISRKYADLCPECAAGHEPEYDAYWKAWYHDRLLCLAWRVRGGESE